MTAVYVSETVCVLGFLQVTVPFTRLRFYTINNPPTSVVSAIESALTWIHEQAGANSAPWKLSSLLVTQLYVSNSRPSKVADRKIV